MESANRLPTLVDAVRIIDRRPSKPTSLVPITSESIAAAAASSGSTTSAWTDGSGATSKPTPIERPWAAVTFPSSSKLTFSSPMHRYPPGAVTTGTPAPSESAAQRG